MAEKGLLAGDNPDVSLAPAHDTAAGAGDWTRCTNSHPGGLAGMRPGRHQSPGEHGGVSPASCVSTGRGPHALRQVLDRPAAPTPRIADPWDRVSPRQRPPLALPGHGHPRPHGQTGHLLAGILAALGGRAPEPALCCGLACSGGRAGARSPWQ